MQRMRELGSRRLVVPVMLLLSNRSLDGPKRANKSYSEHTVDPICASKRRWLIGPLFPRASPYSFSALLLFLSLLFLRLTTVGLLSLCTAQDNPEAAHA